MDLLIRDAAGIGEGSGGADPSPIPTRSPPGPKQATPPSGQAFQPARPSRRSLQGVDEVDGVD